MSVDGAAHSSGSDWARARATLDAVSEIAAEEPRDDLVQRIAYERANSAGGRPVTVVVAGETKRGKSTTVNALVSWPNMLPVDVDVATGAFVLVGYAESPQARVFTDYSEQPIESSVEDIADWVSVSRNPDNEKRVLHMEVGIPAAFLSEGIQVADTPGVGGLNSEHAAMTLTALQGADALVFVLDALAPLSRPELQFLVKAAERIQTVIFVLTKTDLNGGWRTVLDEDRALLEDHAPRFAHHPIFPLQAGDVARAEHKRLAGDEAAAELLIERSGLPPLLHHLRTAVISRAESMRLANSYRLALSALSVLDEGYGMQEDTLQGDTEPLDMLERRRDELAELMDVTDGWIPHVGDGFADLQRDLTRRLDEEVAEFRDHFEAEIDTNWRPQRHLTFAVELDAPTRRIAAELQHALAEEVLATVAAEAVRLGIADLPAPEATLTIPEQETLSPRPLEGRQSRAALTLGALILGEAAQTLRAILSSGGNPLIVFLAPLGLLSSISTVVNQRNQGAQIEKAEARRLLVEYESRFRRDATGAIEDSIRAARDSAITALRRQIHMRQKTVEQQIETLKEQVARVNEVEATRERVRERRQSIARISAECQERLDELVVRKPVEALAGGGR